MHSNKAQTTFSTPDNHVTAEQFQKIADLLYQLTGVHLPPISKNYTMVSSRLNKVLRAHGLANIDALLETIQYPGNTKCRNDFISTLTTHTTHFFREEKHFRILAQHLKEKILAQQKNPAHELRVWCSAVSTGQEALSMLMILLEVQERSEARFPALKFLATDVDVGALKQCTQAQYTENEVENVPSYLLSKYFHKTHVNHRLIYEFKKPYLDQIRFAKLNLLDPSYPFEHQFDIIFCRNVLIYFKEENARHVVNQLAKNLKPGGVLFLGHSESNYGGDQPLLEPYDQAVFQRRES